jgi:sulfite reductase beta subunit-like hemoprotein
MKRSGARERVRNIVASPFSGRFGGRADVRSWVTDLDAAIRAQPLLTDLPGRFWFSVDDGRADVSGLGSDVGAHVFESYRERSSRSTAVAGRSMYSSLPQTSSKATPGAAGAVTEINRDV